MQLAAWKTLTQQQKILQAAQRTENSEEETLPAEHTDNTTLPGTLQAGIENLSGIDMSDVQVHYNSDKPAQLHAHAYAHGGDIHVAPRQEKHLPHEAWHVVQQRQGRVKPTLQMKNGVYVNDDASLENEADVMGAKAASMGSRVTQRKSDGTQVIQKKEQFIPDEKEPHIHVHKGGVTYTDTRHHHTDLESGDQVRKAAITKVMEDLASLGTERAKGIMKWIEATYGVQQSMPPTGKSANMVPPGTGDTESKKS